MAESEPHTPQDLIADRRKKLARLRDEFNVDPYGCRTDGLTPIAEARERYDTDADQKAKNNPEDDQRPGAKVAGRVMLHRVMGNLIFITVRDGSGDIQLAVSKKAIDRPSFNIAKMADLGDIVVCAGPIGTTKTGEITIWATGDGAFAIATKSLAPPPGKWHGLQDAELRYRKRYVDLYVNPQVMRTMRQRSGIIKAVRDFLTDPPGELGPGYLEVETPMMQPIAGGAAARPFTTHHNALDMDLYLRIAPELYLKRLLVGGMSRVFEINRNFRNEGIDRQHNPEFTMLELYQAFGDYNAMMELTETVIHHVATTCGLPVAPGSAGGSDIGNDGGSPPAEPGAEGKVALSFGDEMIDYTLPFARKTYHELFEQHAGFPASDSDKLADLARQHEIDPAGKDHDVLLNEVWEAIVEPTLVQPTFVIDYPASLCPLTKRKADNPDIAERFELFIAGMELANAYTELNDPDIQEANFTQQLAGQDDEEDTFRTNDEDFLESLRVGMPPAGGLGIGIDRLVMLMTNSRSIRDIILFPLMRPKDQ
jgi:lysyl-tRNA synthetase class 2